MQKLTPRLRARPNTAEVRVNVKRGYAGSQRTANARNKRTAMPDPRIYRVACVCEGYESAPR